MDTCVETIRCQLDRVELNYLGNIVDGVKVYDTHNAWYNKRYVAAVSGSWQIELQFEPPRPWNSCTVAPEVNGAIDHTSQVIFYNVHKSESKAFQVVTVSVVTPHIRAGDLINLRLLLDGKPLLCSIKAIWARFTRLSMPSVLSYPLTLTDWTSYRWGRWRRIGDEIECVASAPILPIGMIPACPAHVLEAKDPERYFIRVKVKGWETRIMTCDPDWRFR